MPSFMATEANHDRMSNLSDCILSRILSSLPIKDAVSTSILSTRWRYVIASVFNLDVDLRLIQHSVNSFSNLMNKVLFFHAEGKIERLRFIHKNIPDINSSHVCGWISAALWRGVKELDLVVFYGFINDIAIMLPTSILFVSKTLVRLKLCIPTLLMTVPIHVSLPSLKTLDLRRITFEDDDSVKRLILSCPILEHLSIINCDLQNITRLMISNPSVKSLTIVSNGDSLSVDFKLYLYIISFDLPSLVYFKYKDRGPQDYSMVNMPSLVRADISFCLSQNGGLAQLLQGIGNVKSLHLTVYPAALHFYPRKRFPAFKNLVQLEICDALNEWKGERLFEFLEFSPNLQILNLCNVPKEASYPKEKAPSCLLYKLKKIKVLDFEDESSLFEIVTYIFNNATVLEKFIIRTQRVLEDKEKFRITKELLRMARSSTKCQVEAF